MPINNPHKRWFIKRVADKHTGARDGRFCSFNKGFSLIELMIAMSLFAFSLLAIMSLQVKALGLLSDADLKSQAIILAGSHHELRKLRSKDIQDVDLLLSNWENLVQSKIPEVKITRNTESKKNAYIKLTWPSSHKKANCDGKGGQSAVDCFHL